MTHVRKLPWAVAAVAVVLSMFAASAFALRIKGTPGDDNITGSASRDVVFARGGNDTVSAGAGNDRVVGGQGNDNLLGEQGDDRLFGNLGDDTINGLAGDDRIRGNQGNDTLRGDVAGVGDLFSRDRIWAGPGDDVVYGGDARDRLWGGAGNDQVNGEDGPDLMGGGLGDDTQNGGPGNDRIFANLGADTTYGGDGNDDLWALAIRDDATPGVDHVLGEAGDDRIRTRDNEADIVSCGDGNDVAQLDSLDVIEDATADNANGSCEKVVRRAPNRKDTRAEDKVQDSPDQDKQS